MALSDIETEIHYTEVGLRGKPDERDTNLANRKAAFFRTIVPLSRFDIRTSGRYESETGKLVVDIAGEVSPEILDHPGLDEELTELVRQDFMEVERVETVPPELEVRIGLNRQNGTLAANKRAGDSGHAITVAYADTPLNLPWERFTAVFIRDAIDNIFHQNGAVPAPIEALTGIKHIDWLRSDGKISVEAEYAGAGLLGLRDIVVAVQHEESVNVREVREKIKSVTEACIRILEGYGISLGRPNISVNKLGKFTKGGWYTDAGSREAKPYRDGFSSYGTTEDSFAGEDPSKPSAVITLLARNAGCLLVQSGYAKFAKVTARKLRIGEEMPELHVFTNRTRTKGLTPNKLNELVNKEVHPLSLADAVEEFGLGRPETYDLVRRTSDYFQNEAYRWNGKPQPLPPSYPKQ